MLRHILIWSVGLFLIASLNSAEACSCLPLHPQQQYCNADFVIVGIPKRRVEDGLVATYTVQLTATIKMVGGAKAALKKGLVQTNLNSAACGVFLELEQQYILMGKIENGKAVVSLCDYTALWSQLTAQQKRTIIRFKDACKCSVNTSFGEVVHKTPRACTFDLSQSNSMCYRDYGICLKNGRSCSWENTPALVQCLTPRNAA